MQSNLPPGFSDSPFTADFVPSGLGNETLVIGPPNPEALRPTSLRPDEPGVKFDADKVRFDLLPVRPLESIAQVLTLGAKKYSERNWEKGFSWSRPFAACLRHLFAFWRGEKYDPETGLPHLAHAACNILFLLEFSEVSRAGKDDRPVRPPPG